ncbi:hypothetical protein GLAREA_06114 [Glarea lozoyensis ATCC 20868]|uniref:Uncharacterized protein n=1 Tax=Glarea lozoyensis (strain ATCC 20868 / MF5171) TaxID=1116229 RepID=S3D3P4_GLAL2|nr:uncharacterized protein GLAREA_06114 [Glarea lozoyensis ATCC 20868]EPE33102.1 hypothetical protein GLAREA_06114 [Glarea lozoyensis ATCC 20868]
MWGKNQKNQKGPRPPDNFDNPDHPGSSKTQGGEIRVPKLFRTPSDRKRLIDRKRAMSCHQLASERISILKKLSEAQHEVQKRQDELDVLTAAMNGKNC